MKKFFLVLVAFLFLFNFVCAADATCVYFFYGDGCAHCAKVEPFIDALAMNSELNVALSEFEVYSNRSNIVLLNDLFDAHEIETSGRGVPAVFVGDKIFIGDAQILANLENAILTNAGAECPLSSTDDSLNELSILAVISARSSIR